MNNQKSSIEMLLAQARVFRVWPESAVYAEQLEPVTRPDPLGLSLDDVWPDAFSWSPGDPC